MGTDHIGGAIYGRRISLQMEVIAVLIGAFTGIVVGLVAGTYGGLVDNIIMRLIDVLVACPGILLALPITVIFGVGLFSAMIAVGIAPIPNSPHSFDRACCK